MFKQMRQWQNAFTVTLLLVCLGIGMSHNIEATLAPDHGEHCSICLSGNSTPLIFNDALSLEFSMAGATTEKTSIACGYQNHAWPDAPPRAPPLV